MQLSNFSILHVFLASLLTLPALINAAAAPTSPDDMVGIPDSATGDMKKDMEGDSPFPISNGGINAPKGGGGGGGGGAGGGRDGGGGGGSAALLGSSSTSGATAVQVGSLGALVIAAAGVAML